jgi:hypothetical protein
MLESLSRALEMCHGLPHPFDKLRFPLSHTHVQECASAMNLTASGYSMSVQDNPSINAESSMHMEKVRNFCKPAMSGD